MNLLKTEAAYKKRYDVLTKKKVVKYQGFIKCIFYLLGFKKEDICVDGSQLLFWKKARHLWNDKLIDKMKNYKIQGSMNSEVKSY